MKVHLQQIPPEGKHYEGEDPNSILDLHEPEVQPVSPVHYQLDVGLSGGGLFATGQVGVTMRLQCVSCLERFSRPVEVADFACQVELTGNETVDLTDPIREDILLALPAHPRCDWNGERVCPGASIPAKLQEEAAAPDTEPPAVWSALDQLKIKT
jgi:uncharacterized protein